MSAHDYVFVLSDEAGKKASVMASICGTAAVKDLLNDVVAEAVAHSRCKTLDELAAIIQKLPRKAEIVTGESSGTPETQTPQPRRQRKKSSTTPA